MSRYALIILWTICSSLSASTALGQGEESAQVHRIAVLSVVSEGADDKLAAQITRVIKSEAKTNSSFELVQQEDIALFESLLLFGCEEVSSSCMLQLARSLEADRLIYGNLTKVDDLYDISVEIFDVAEARTVERWHKRFTPDVDTIGFFSEEMGRFIGGRALIKPTVLRISCNVRSAQVLLDGQLVGRTPFMTEKLSAGPHKVEVTREGYTNWVREVEMARGKDHFYKVTLQPLSVEKVDFKEGPEVPAPLEAPDTASLSAYGWVSLALGSAALVGGGIMGGLSDQSQSDFDATDIEIDARSLKDRGEQQAMAANGLFALGGALAVTGVILLIADAGEDQGEAPSLKVGPTTEGAALFWQTPF